MKLSGHFYLLVGFLAAIAMDKTGVLGSVEGADRALDIACITGALACTKPGI